MIILCYDKNKYKRNGKEGMRMKKTKKYDVEGATLTIPLRYDEDPGRYSERMIDVWKRQKRMMSKAQR